MRVLEDALQLAQMQQSDEQHPLLRTPFKMDDEEPETQEPVDTAVEDELVDVMGSLHINERDKSVQFYGPGGGAEVRGYYSTVTEGAHGRHFIESVAGKGFSSST